jgi:hypothetical protein
VDQRYDSYNGTPPHENTETSKEAALMIADKAPSMMGRVFVFIIARGAYGATDDEIEVALNFRHQTASARRRELVIKGMIVQSGKRATRSGRYAAVWIKTPPGTQLPL